MDVYSDDRGNLFSSGFAYPRLCVAQGAIRLPVADRHTIADHLVEGLIMLQEGTGEVVVGQFGNRFVNSRSRELRVQFNKGLS